MKATAMPMTGATRGRGQVVRIRTVLLGRLADTDALTPIQEKFRIWAQTWDQGIFKPRQTQTARPTSSFCMPS